MIKALDIIAFLNFSAFALAKYEIRHKPFGFLGKLGYGCPQKKLNVEDYLELEKTSQVRHEYVDGELLAMAGEKRRHNNLVRPSVESYVLISQSSRFVIVYKREGNKWLVEPLDETGQFDVLCLNMTITLEQLYTGIL